MSPASRTLGVIGLVLAIGAQPAALGAQSPFDPIARRVLALKLQSEIMRGRVNEGWQPAAWNDSLAAMGTGVERLSAEARRLERQEVKVAPQLVALVERVRIALEMLARSRDQRSARTALTHLGAGLDALEQKIAEGEASWRKE